ncbi:MAG: hydroxyethylthiazole kinase [Methanosphaera stadtmanae]|jgi:hydroxyethylthiazole kinase|nr:hydroxyethylthiazole kinase [Methanosphaera stadtmanae]
MSQINDKIIETVENLRSRSPLTHCITNFVTINDCANAVLAIGGSPIMANEPDEAEEMVTVVNTLLINIGTLYKSQIEAMKIASQTAAKLQKAYVLDPVGIGVSKIRNDTTMELMKEAKPSIIRGNLSEIKTLAMLYEILDECTQAKGVDVADTDVINEDTLDSNVKLVESIAQKLDTTIAVSGQIDIISDGKDTYVIRNGHPMLSDITGSGCMLGCLMASYAAVTTPIMAATTAAAVMAIAGEVANQKVAYHKKGTGTFRSELIDALSLMDEKIINRYANITKN